MQLLHTWLVVVVMFVWVVRFPSLAGSTSDGDAGCSVVLFARWGAKTFNCVLQCVLCEDERYWGILTCELLQEPHLAHVPGCGVHNPRTCFSTRTRRIWFSALGTQCSSSLAEHSSSLWLHILNQSFLVQAYHHTWAQSSIPSRTNCWWSGTKVLLWYHLDFCKSFLKNKTKTNCGMGWQVPRQVFADMVNSNDHWVHCQTATTFEPSRPLSRKWFPLAFWNHMFSVCPFNFCLRDVIFATGKGWSWPVNFESRGQTQGCAVLLTRQCHVTGGAGLWPLLALPPTDCDADVASVVPTLRRFLAVFCTCSSTWAVSVSWRHPHCSEQQHSKMGFEIDEASDALWRIHTNQLTKRNGNRNVFGFYLGRERKTNPCLCRRARSRSSSCIRHAFQWSTTAYPCCPDSDSSSLWVKWSVITTPQSAQISLHSFPLFTKKEILTEVCPWLSNGRRYALQNWNSILHETLRANSLDKCRRSNAACLSPFPDFLMQRKIKLLLCRELKVKRPTRQSWEPVVSRLTPVLAGVTRHCHVGLPVVFCTLHTFFAVTGICNGEKKHLMTHVFCITRIHRQHTPPLSSPRFPHNGIPHISYFLSGSTV